MAVRVRHQRTISGRRSAATRALAVVMLLHMALTANARLATEVPA